MQMTMKIIYGHIAAVSLLLFAGCSLKEQLISDSRTEDWFETPQECRTGINACYNPIRNQLGGYNFWVVSDQAGRGIDHLAELLSGGDEDQRSACGN